MKPTLEQLKSQAYDCLVQIEIWKKSLQEINAQITNFKEENKPEEEIAQTV